MIEPCGALAIAPFSALVSSAPDGAGSVTTESALTTALVNGLPPGPPTVPSEPSTA